MKQILFALFRAACIRGTQALLLTCVLALSALAAVAPPGTVIPNIANGLFTIGGKPIVSTSNEVDVEVPLSGLIGVAKQAGQPVANLDASGKPDGTATVAFTLRVRNYGDSTLYKVSLVDQIEGSGSTQLGAYTASTVPGAGQYTVVANSLSLVSSTAPLTSASLNQGFTGQAAQNNLLQGDVALPVGTEFTLRFEVRFNLGGRSGSLYNTARACAAGSATGLATICDDSVDGFNPDANGDGNPNNDGSPTPVPTQLPALALLKSVSAPRATATAGTYEVDYTLSVSNVGNAPAPRMHLLDNLDCTFQIGQSQGAVASWRLLSAPVSKTGTLLPAATFTGQGVGDCGSSTPYDFPAGSALDLLDGSQTLAAGQSEAITMTLELTLKPEFVSSGALLTNKGWAWSESATALNSAAGKTSAKVGGKTVASASNVLAWAYSSVDLILSSASPSVSAFTLRKDGSSAQAEIGDQLDFTLTLQNTGATALKGVSVRDQLPPGFTYVPGTAQTAQVSSTGATPNWVPVADPARGSALIFNMPGLEIASKALWAVRYRVRVGPGVPSNGVAINQAQATVNGTLSNLATWRVTVSGGVFADEAFAFGKVFMDCNRDGIQSDGEQGIPGVRLMIEDGTSVITDIDGKWSLYGLRPVTHALKIDATTLPAGAHLSALTNRHAGVGDSQFLDLKKGEWHKANFAVDNCEAPGLQAEVKERRRLIEADPAREADAGARLRSRLDPKGLTPPIAEPRALPASGEIGRDGNLRANTTPARALIELPAGSGGLGGLGGVAAATQQAQSFLPQFAPNDARALAGTPVAPNARPDGLLDDAPQEGPPPAATREPLEQQVAELDNALGFIDLKDGAVMPARQVNLRIKGPAAGRLALKVNGEALADTRIGKRVKLEGKDLQAFEYIAVPLKPGSNQLEAELSDNFGNPRERVQITVTAPGPLARIELSLPETAPADGKTPVVVKLRLLDAAGVPVQARTMLNLETSAGRWNVKDLNQDEPGVQVFVEGGQAELELLPPTAPGDGRIRLSSNRVAGAARLAYLPDLRPLTGIGVVEGVIDLTKRGTINLGSSARGAFESELNSFSTQSGDTTVAARTAFFFKGTIAGEYLLTTAYDSDKQKNVQMFRDIRPDQFYPVYGDSSVKTFDAQSVGKLYVRIDKNRSYLLYGDFVTASSPEVRQLSQISRSVSGLRHHFEDSSLRVDSYASRDTLTQQIQEFPANGTSGPFTLPGLGDMVVNSETIEVLVRDRSQPQTVLKSTALTRFVDYTIEPYSKTLLLKAPVSSVDLDLNPQSIRVSYTVDAGGTPFWVGGVDAQYKLRDDLQVGAVLATDNNPNGGRKLAAATALARLDDKTTLSAEVVETNSDLKGSGNAGRIELRRMDEQTNLLAQVAKTGTSFDNPNSTMAAGQTVGNLKLEQSLSPTTKLRAEALYSASDITGSTTNMRGAAVSVQERLSDTLVGEVGLRTGQQSGNGAGAFNYGTVSSANGPSMSQTGVSASNLGFTSVRGRLTSKVPDHPEAEVFVEGEQGLNDASRRAISVGGNYRLTEKTRVYGRYALVSSLYNSPYDANSTQQNNVGLIGFESQYSESGRVFNEYRVVDTIDGRGAQAAMGLRQTLKITDNLRGIGGIEHTGALGGVVGQASNAVTGGLEYTQGDYLRSSGTLELRNGTDSNSVLNTLGVALKLDRDWSLLARSIVSDTRSRTSTGTSTLLQRQQLGFAYRPVDQDEWNAIARYEHRLQRTDNGGGATLLVPGISDLAWHIISAQANLQVNRYMLASARYAIKWNSTRSDALTTSTVTQLLMGRVTYDLTSEWDLGVQSGLATTRNGSRQLLAGLEAGYQVMPNLWMSGGYNFMGIKDPDLGGSSFTSKGAYVRMRFKFDENTISPRDKNL